VPFNTNILRIALNMKEEKIAQVLVAEYQIAIDEKMIIRAVKTKQMNFLYCVWAFNKNYEYIGHEESDESIRSSPRGSNSQDDQDNEKNY